MRKLIGTLLAAATLAPGAGAYPWPLKPFGQPHPVQGNFGDPRTIFFNQPPESIYSPGIFNFHNGIDISAPGGTPVYPVADGRVHILSPTVVAVLTPGAEFKYVHINPVVFEGEPVFRSSTVLGYVATWARHLHFTEIRHHRVVDPLRRGAIAPYFDQTKPVVTELVVRDESGATITAPPYRVCRTVSVSAAAEDPTSMPIPGIHAGLPVTPAIVAWELRTADGRVVVPHRLAVDFLHGLPTNKQFWSIYAHGTFQNVARFGHTQVARLEGYYLFRLAPRLDTTRLPNGMYVLTVTAEDVRGNQGRLSETLTVANGTSDCAA